MTDKATLHGTVHHPAFYCLSPELRERARVHASRHHVLLSFDRAEDVQRASDELREWDPEGRKYEHHIRDLGNIVIDWDE